MNRRNFLKAAAAGSSWFLTLNQLKGSELLPAAEPHQLELTCPALKPDIMTGCLTGKLNAAFAPVSAS